ncbi:hypothetical protein PR048_026015 [Dryococelus australis]|uniref:Uncharacterized protein n=1 Tax=Dryococelus australis TaxID=614101 RepID=A0ABQ9GK58_9NEOP|nr:hypothetical protein PR048_026015 [Dryococelus australis]
MRRTRRSTLECNDAEEGKPKISEKTRRPTVSSRPAKICNGFHGISCAANVDFAGRSHMSYALLRPTTLLLLAGLGVGNSFEQAIQFIQCFGRRFKVHGARDPPPFSTCSKHSDMVVKNTFAQLPIARMRKAFNACKLYLPQRDFIKHRNLNERRCFSLSKVILRGSYATRRNELKIAPPPLPPLNPFHCVRCCAVFTQRNIFFDPLASSGSVRRFDKLRRCRQSTFCAGDVPGSMNQRGRPTMKRHHPTSCRTAKAGETEDPRKNPPTRGIIRHDSYTRKYGSDPPPPGGGESNTVYLVKRRAVRPLRHRGPTIHKMTGHLTRVSASVGTTPCPCTSDTRIRSRVDYADADNNEIHQNSPGIGMSVITITTPTTIIFIINLIIIIIIIIIIFVIIHLFIAAVIIDWRFQQLSMEQRRNERAGEMGYPRKKKNPPASGIVWHDSHMRESGDPAAESFCPSLKTLDQHRKKEKEERERESERERERERERESERARERVPPHDQLPPISPDSSRNRSAGWVWRLVQQFEDYEAARAAAAICESASASLCAVKRGTDLRDCGLDAGALSTARLRVEAMRELMRHVSVAPSAPTLLGLRRAKYLQPDGHVNEWDSAGMQGRGKTGYPRENPQTTRPGIEPGSLQWEVSSITANPTLPSPKMNSPLQHQAIPSDRRRAAREVTNGREICDCEYQAVKSALTGWIVLAALVKDIRKDGIKETEHVVMCSLYRGQPLMGWTDRDRRLARHSSNRGVGGGGALLRGSPLQVQLSARWDFSTPARRGSHPYLVLVQASTSPGARTGLPAAILAAMEDSFYTAAVRVLAFGTLGVISPRKNLRLAAIPRCENPRLTPPEIEPGSPRWEASNLTTTPPWPQLRIHVSVLIVNEMLPQSPPCAVTASGDLSGGGCCVIAHDTAKSSLQSFGLMVALNGMAARMSYGPALAW